MLYDVCYMLYVICYMLYVVCYMLYGYDGPKRPKRGSLKHLKFTGKCEFRDFWDPAEICRKLPENYETGRKLR